MGYMIHFNEDIVRAEELKLIKTKQAILEKLRVRFGFGDMAMPQPPGAQLTTGKRLLATPASQLR
jgi:hypothetical protein